MPTPKKVLRKRVVAVVTIPTENNRIYGDDVPMPWREAAQQAGIPESTFRRLIDRREVSVLNHPGRVMVRPSAVREYLASREVRRV